MKNVMEKIGAAAVHLLILAVVFAVSVLVFMRTINQVSPDAAENMKTSTFPLVYMRRNGTNFNCLHGFEKEMNARLLRESITPLQTDRSVDVMIQSYSASIDSVSYEVIDPVTGESLENTQVIKLDRDHDYLYATLTLQNRMLMNKEYVLKLCLRAGGRSIWYYTRVLLEDGLHTDEYLNFVSGFYDKTVNKSDLGTVGAAVEPDETTDAEQTLAYMDIHDSVEQLTWGSLNPQIYYKPTPRIVEINENTASLTNEYRIAAVGDSGMTEVFNVQEFYRVRYTDSRVFLLNFERTTNEVFNPENNVLEKKGIRLGITGKEVQTGFDSRQKVIAFVQENELWTYEKASGKLTQIFSFPQKQDMDYRDFYDNHEILILRVNAQGDVWFTVNGYMNRGSHEGGCGVMVCRYEAATDMVDEMAYLDSTESPELLMRDTGNLSYVTEDGSAFYVLLEERILRVSLRDRSITEMAEGICEDCFAGKAGNRYFAWLEEGRTYDSASLSVLDLETGEKTGITAPAGERIRPVCYMGEDLVYGLAREDDLAAASMEMGYFPMYTLHIVSPSGETVKEYVPKGCFVTEVEQSDNLLALTRVEKNASGTGYVPGTPDRIVSTDTSASVAVGIATSVTSRKQTVITLRVGEEIDDLKPEVLRSKIVTYETPRTVEIPENDNLQSLYSVYASGGLLDRFERVNEAVACADAHVGVVVDENLSYVWVRGDRSVTADVPLKNVPEAFSAGERDVAALGEKTGLRILDLTGCTLDQMYYFISHGRAVAVTGDEGPLTIVGYDEFNTHLLEPGAEEWYYFGSDDSTELFARFGNRFISYMENEV